MSHSATSPRKLPPVVRGTIKLHYVSDAKPGITRRKAGKGFRYVDADGKGVRDRQTLARIQSLVIPPAWSDVWICPRADGHIQAVGRDERARKQYVYHADYRTARDEMKFERIVAFGKVLPRIRRAVARDLARPGLARRKVLAAVVKLLETSLIRVGNDEYAKANGSFGLTTLRDRHVKITGGLIHFDFRGKSGVAHEIDISDRRLARIVKACQDLPGQELFQYVNDDGEVCDVGSADVNQYIRDVAGDDFTAKDFRTWAGTVLAALALKEFEAFDSETQAKRNVMAAIKSVAQRLGNTPAVCRTSYIHPRIIDAYLQGTMLDAMRRRAANAMKHVRNLSPEEAAVLALLQRRLVKHD
ncbi:MAG TPA: DNA topoisomerase IB [Gemmataceae bacterium]|jgi:DNA topoisomerase-1|nr:DNA topoisomerase IB [Gemmataceae bacterium]